MMTTDTELEVCTAGSQSLADGDLRPFTARPGVSVDDQTGLHVLRLLALHPDVVRFRLEKLSEMDEQTKKSLIADIYAALDIKLPVL